MDTLGSTSYVSLTVDEIHKRFQELMEEEQLGLTLAEPGEAGEPPEDTYNPYDRG